MKYFSYLVIFLTVLCIYSWMVNQAAIRGNNFKAFHKQLIQFATFPQKIEDVFRDFEKEQIPVSYLVKDNNFSPVNKLNKDLFGVTSIWNQEIGRWEILLINLRNDSILHTWHYGKKKFKRSNVDYIYCTIKEPIILENKDLIGHLYASPNMFRLDSNSNVIWKNEEYDFHHSLNQDAEGYIWTCTRDIFKGKYENNGGGIVKNVDGQVFSYKEEYIDKIDPEDGKILFHKGVAEILIDNGLKGLFYGSSLYDPLHINDVQPALKDSKYWKKGDVFISIRNRSTIILYRPTTNKIVKLIQAPIVNQHDIDIISDHEISIFNNNIIFSTGFKGNSEEKAMDALNTNEIIVYNFEKDSFSILAQEVFEKEEINTFFQGLSEVLSDGSLFVEEQNSGIYFLIKDNEVILRKVLPVNNTNYIQKPNWMRVYENLPFQMIQTKN
ncbi:MAG: arylsulfotransferase family protein [Chitinophagales bacterium]